MPSTSFVKHEGEFPTSQDQSTQTDWIYESKMGKGPCPPTHLEARLRGCWGDVALRVSHGGGTSRLEHHPSD